MLLAEANQWPSDVRAYFGDADGDECHMAFHFPLMPRLFMALRQEDRHPISEVLYQTPELPDACQWAIFLRNHDELTLEMVGDEERDYMYETYAADPQMRINVGIRRRLAPLMENSRPRIELLTGLLLSLPGTPVLYYGDEIGMGDNVYLGDRNGVRTPMQWSADRNGGFSRADTARLYAPPIMDPVYGFQSVNVEAQERSPHSLLNWMRRMIALRQQHTATFGRGTMEMLRPLNRRVFAFIRRSPTGAPVLIVANLSRTVQAVSLDLARVAGLIPIEMTGGVELPRITEAPYPLTLGPYHFYWLLLLREPPTAAGPRPVTLPAEPQLDQAPLLVGPEWWKLLDGSIRQMLETRYLPSFLRRQPWFGPHHSRIRRVAIEDWGTLATGDEPALLAILRVSFDDEPEARYVLPLVITPGERGEEIRQHTPDAVLAQIGGARKGVMHARLDGLAGRQLIAAVMAGRDIGLRRGRVRGSERPGFDTLGLPRRVDDLPAAPFDFERFHSSIGLGERVVLKVLRRLWPDPNPERVVREALHTEAHFTGVPTVAGMIQYEEAGGSSSTIALLDAFIEHQTDGWRHALADLRRFIDDAGTFGEAPVVPHDLARLWTLPTPERAAQTVGTYLGVAATLGARTAELHGALADERALERLGAARIDEQAIATWLADTRACWQRTRTLLAARSAAQADVESGSAEADQRVAIDRLIEKADSNLHTIDSPDLSGMIGALLTQIHGNLDLAHVLIYETTVTFIGPAGDGTRSPESRRRPRTPLEDVAVMLRSLHTAAGLALDQHAATPAHQRDVVAAWARCWTAWSGATFLAAYQRTAGGAPWLAPDASVTIALLRLLLFQQACDDIAASLDARPAWLHLSLALANDLLEGDAAGTFGRGYSSDATEA
jgi:maltose alpha-D-glucosyltransferase/alpha-amylase